MVGGGAVGGNGGEVAVEAREDKEAGADDAEGDFAVGPEDRLRFHV